MARRRGGAQGGVCQVATAPLAVATGTVGAGLAGSGGASLSDKQHFACSLVEGAVAAVVRTGAGCKLVASATYAAVAAALAGGGGQTENSDSEDEDMPGSNGWQTACSCTGSWTAG